MAVGLLAGIFTACAPQSKAFANQCVFITGSGLHDSGRIKHVLYPGDVVNRGDDEDWYVPCNSRNYITTPDQSSGDYHGTYQGLTGKGADNEPGAQIIVNGISAFWALNQKEAALREWFPFCQKYACANGSPKGDRNQSASNFSSPGWNAMLRENFPYAIDRAVGRAALKFGPNLWEDRSQWQDFGDEVGKDFMQEIHSATGSDYNWFCASGGDLKKVCRPVRFTIENIDPADASLRALKEGAASASNKTASELAQIQQQQIVDDAKHAQRIRQIQQENQEAQEEAKLWDTPGYREQKQWEHDERIMHECAQSQHCTVGRDGYIQQ
jgi:hypothetical protein